MIDETFVRILDGLEELQTHLPIIFPVHPRTRKRIDEFGLTARIGSIKDLRLVEPFGYLDFLKLMAESKRAVEKSFNNLNGRVFSTKMPDLWNGKSAQRIIKILMEKL